MNAQQSTVWQSLLLTSVIVSIYYGLNNLTNILITNHSSIALFGKMSLTLFITSYVYRLLTLGFPALINIELPRYFTHGHWHLIKGLLVISVSLSILSALILAIWIHLPPVFHPSDPYHYLIINILMWTVPSSALYSISRYTLTTFNSPKITLFFSEIIYPLLLVITLLGMISTSIEVTISRLIAMIVICKTIIVIVITCRLWLQKSRLFKKHPIKFQIYAWIRRSIPLLLYDLAARSNLTIIMILEEIFDQNTNGLGLFAILLGLTSVYYGFYRVLIGTLATPAIAICFEQEDQAQRVLSRYIRLGFLIGMTLFGLFWLIGQDLLALFGKQAVAGYSALLFLCLGEATRLGLGVFISILSLSQLNRDLNRINTIALIVSVSIAPLLITHLQYEGAAIALSIGLIIRYGLATFIMITKTPFRL